MKLERAGGSGHHAHGRTAYGDVAALLLPVVFLVLAVTYCSLAIHVGRSHGLTVVGVLVLPWLSVDPCRHYMGYEVYVMQKACVAYLCLFVSMLFGFEYVVARWRRRVSSSRDGAGVAAVRPPLPPKHTAGTD